MPARPPPKAVKATKKRVVTKTRPPKPAAKPAQAKARKPQRTKAPAPAPKSPGTALALPAAPPYHVGLQVDGSVIAINVASGAHQVIEAAIVRQILGMAAMLRPAA